MRRLIAIGLLTALCGCASTNDVRHAAAADEQDAAYAHLQSELHRLVAELHATLKLAAEAPDFERLNLIVPVGSSVVNDGYALSLWMDQSTSLYWLAEQGGIAGTTTWSGPVDHGNELIRSILARIQFDMPVNKLATMNLRGDSILSTEEN